MMDMEKAVDILSFSIVNGLKSMMNISLKNNNYIVNILSFFMPFGKSRNGLYKPQHGMLLKSEDR